MAASQKRRIRPVPLRSCVVCREPSDKHTLLRVVRLPEKDGHGVVVDQSGKRAGRGAYVCASAACIDLAQKQRRFQGALSVDSAAITPELYLQLKALVAPLPDVDSDAVEPTNGA